MSIDYNLNSIFILTAVKRNNTMQRRGTCFAISKSLVLTAKHNDLTTLIKTKNTKLF